MSTFLQASWNKEALESALLLGNWQSAIQMARNWKRQVTSRQEYAVCLCVEIQALFEMGREEEARYIAATCVTANGIGYENFSLFNTCVSLFLVSDAEGTLELAETALLRWYELETTRMKQGKGGGMFSVEQRKHLLQVLLFHVLLQRGLEGIERGRKCIQQVSGWDWVDRDWLEELERELANRKEEMIRKASSAKDSSLRRDSSSTQDEWMTTTRTTRATRYDEEEEEYMENAIETNDEEEESKNWIDSPLFRISVMSALCLLLYVWKRKSRVTSHRSWVQSVKDILSMAFGLSYGRPGI